MQEVKRQGGQQHVASSSRPSLADTGAAATIPTALRAHAHRLTTDQSSGFDYQAVGESLRQLKTLVLGEKIAHGMVVTFGARTPQLHILNTEVKPILESLRHNSGRISECVERYQGISGTTPSTSALRVFSLVLKKIAPEDPETRARLKSICDEARELDLISPANKDWKREMTMQISGRNVRLSLSLVPLSSLEKLAHACVSTDLPKEALKNQYSYHLTLEPETLRESAMLRHAKQAGRQLVTASVFAAPMIGIAPLLSGLGDLAQVSILTATMAATCGLLRYANSKMLLKPQRVP